MNNSKIQMLTGAEIDLRYTVANLLQTTISAENHYIVYPMQYPNMILHGFFDKSKLGCELSMFDGGKYAPHANGRSRVGNLRDWLQGENRDSLVWITCGRWSERVIGAQVDHKYSRLFLET